MKASRRKIMLMVMTCCVMLIAACSSGTSTPSVSKSNNSPENTSSGTNETTAPPQEEYVIKILTQDNNQIKRSDETKIGKFIKEKFNIVFDFVQTPGNYTDKLNLMLAGGDYPEIIKIQDNATFDKYVRAGALLPLDDFAKNSPDFAKMFNVQIPLWKLTAPDGKLYKWEGGVPVDFKNYVEVLDIGVRTDALKQQGWPNLLSTDDYIKFLKQALKDNPTTNGQKTLGMIIPFAEPWGMQGISTIMYEKGGRYTAAAGNMGVIWNQVDKKFEDTMTNEYVKESLGFFNRLYREGILDKDSFTDKYDQFVEKLNSGRALSSWYVVWGLSTANQGLIDAGHPEMQYINMPVRSMKQMERNEKRQIRVEDTRPFDIYAITKNAKHPERFKELLAWGATEEGRILLQSGFEGEEYTIVDGKRVPTEAYKKTLTDADAQRNVGFGLFNFLGNVLTNGQDGVPYTMGFDPKIQDELGLTKGMREAYNALGWESSKDYYLKTGEVANTGIAGTVSIDTTSDLGALHQKMVDFRVKNSTNLIIKPQNDEEFETLYQSIISDYQKLKPELVVNEYNRIYQEKQDQLNQLK
ncbi:ABC transporter substrate-binding protein [Paenibacillus baekrokdamisoli]|uniref:ABC transporter substrate-binding protein n=1 Tax=Paenibacillus baekrokdamisoli TaxID=1712516 RepID=A0A3G9IN66_9BACL|nr:extracellular solute-binding protein [Paenibacillus baekrokdamisoli]MBB3067064.1 ABC-type glycerol-3-phosphate transport system substrate-binding protein [Paenibacillus baekrokdamisoli]BBH19746.1 ABC transporter substrate-binding protein [Paenibacillus baekrokdamisoli]